MMRLMIVAAVLGMSSVLAANAPPQLQWPAPPQSARLTYVGEVTGEPLHPSLNKLSRILRVLLGIESGASMSGSRRLIQPTGICVFENFLYVADPGNHGVLRYNQRDQSAEWLPKERSMRLVSPVGVTVNAQGQTFILDSVLRKVFIIGREGTLAGELEGDPQSLGRPAAVAASDRRVYVSDVKNHRIVVFGVEGVYLHSFGRRGSGSGEFNYPTYLWFDSKTQRLWVSDSGNFRIQWFDADGKYLGSFGQIGNRPGYLARPRGLALDQEGHVYVSDGAFDAVQIFNSDGRLLLFVGQAGSVAGEFNLPGGVFLDSSNRLFVADTHNARIQVFQYLKESGQ